MRTSPSLRAIIALFAVLLPFGGTLALSMLELPVLCGFRRLLGAPCPGCGMTRSFAALARLDVGAALEFHPLGPLYALYLGSIWMTAWWSYFQRGKLASPVAERIPGLLHLALIGLLIAVWLVRFTGLLGGPAAPVDPRSGLLLSLVGVR